MKILLIPHKPIDSATPRGGEKSVSIIVRFLQARGHEVRVSNIIPAKDKLLNFDTVLTWGRPAAEVAKACEAAGVPMVLMVRFWKNIAPLPAGNLATRPVDRHFTELKAHIFRTTKAIITNSMYAKSVIHRWQPDAVGKTHVSYVPITGHFQQSGDQGGALTIVTPEIYGEYRLVKQLAPMLTNNYFQVVNCDQISQLRFSDIAPSVVARGYCDMADVFRRTKILLLPVYDNDICGTRRVTIEAFRHGIPVIAMDRSGMREKVPPTMLIRQNAGPNEWLAKIQEIERNYELFRRRARMAWERYDTENELLNFEKILIECVS